VLHAPAIFPSLLRLARRSRSFSVTQLGPLAPLSFFFRPFFLVSDNFYPSTCPVRALTWVLPPVPPVRRFGSDASLCLPGFSSAARVRFRSTGPSSPQPSPSCNFSSPWGLPNAKIFRSVCCKRIFRVSHAKEHRPDSRAVLVIGGVPEFSFLHHRFLGHAQGSSSSWVTLSFFIPAAMAPQVFVEQPITATRGHLIVFPLARHRRRFWALPF